VARPPRKRALGAFPKIYYERYKRKMCCNSGRANPFPPKHKMIKKKIRKSYLAFSLFIYFNCSFILTFFSLPLLPSRRCVRYGVVNKMNPRWQGHIRTLLCAPVHLPFCVHGVSCPSVARVEGPNTKKKTVPNGGKI
jgi:hypothetical protein